MSSDDQSATIVIAAFVLFGVILAVIFSAVFIAPVLVVGGGINWYHYSKYRSPKAKERLAKERTQLLYDDACKTRSEIPDLTEAGVKYRMSLPDTANEEITDACLISPNVAVCR